MTSVTVVMGVIVGVLVGLLTRVVGDLLRPQAEKHRKLVVSMFVGVVALSAFIALRSSVDNVEVAPAITPTSPTPYAGDTRIILVTEGHQETVILGTDEIVVSVGSKSGGLVGVWADDRSPAETITATTSTDNQSREMRVGDCLMVRPFTVSIHDINTVGTDTVTLVIARISADADSAACRIEPTPTRLSFP